MQMSHGLYFKKVNYSKKNTFAINFNSKLIEECHK